MKLKTAVTAIDSKARTLATDSGESIPYDRLLVAVGGAPFMPPVPGLDGPDVYTFVKKEDAVQLVGAVRPGEKVVVIGAGLIGLKAAESLNMRGVGVTLVEAFRLLGMNLDETAGAMVIRHLEQKGLTIHEYTMSKAILRDGLGRVVGVETDKHGILEARAVVMAAGVRPDLRLAREAGIAVSRGILADEYLATSDPDIFTAGDVAEALDLITRKPTVLPIWPNAYKQGVYAGTNMAGEKTSSPGPLSLNSVAVYGLPCMSAGIVNPPDNEGYETNVHLDEKSTVYRKLVFKNNRLAGYILLGNVDFAGFYTGFVRFQIDLDEETMGHLLTGRPTPLDWPEELLPA